MPDREGMKSLYADVRWPPSHSGFSKSKNFCDQFQIWYYVCFIENEKYFVKKK